MLKQPECLVCDGPLVVVSVRGGGPRKYCSQACASKAFKRRHPERVAAGLKRNYQRNKAREVKRAGVRRQTVTEWLVGLKGAPCADCGLTFPAICMDWHHRDPAAKSFRIGGAERRHGRDAILAEMAKCDLLCANCHRIRHAPEAHDTEED